VSPRTPHNTGQRGAALLAAMLTVALVATLAAAGLWQQWRSVEVEAAERTRLQARWVLTGALDWARLILREDGREGGADHLAEPWAVPLQEARLATFLAADRNADSDGSDAANAFLSGEIVDMQSRLNVNLLVDGGKVSDTGLAAFQRLFEVLSLPADELTRMAEKLLSATEIGSGSSAASQAPLAPQSPDQLGWLGLSAETVQVLRPHVIVLPARTPINLNTASALVIYAAVPGISQADAQRLVAARDASPFRTLADAAKLLSSDQGVGGGMAAVATRYFEVRGRLRLDRTVVEERSLVQRDGSIVRILRREYTVLDPGGASPNR
jgi:general secretion pathway protein K